MSCLQRPNDTKGGARARRANNALALVPLENLHRAVIDWKRKVARDIKFDKWRPRRVVMKTLGQRVREAG